MTAGSFPKRLGAMAAAAAALTLVGSAPALAIPSPEVVVSFFSNIAQIFGLLTLAVGGAFFSRQRVSRRLRRGGGPAARFGAGKVLAVLTLMLLASAGINVMQWSWSADARTERLSANLFRASKEAGKRVGDTSLKTLDYSEQVKHPLGITTAELDAMLAANGVEADDDEPVNLIDVRESEEWETGKLTQFSHLRYPDVLAQAEAIKANGKRNVLLCHSGNRSSELCEALIKKGVDCRFIVGGYEKWLAEGRGIVRNPALPASAVRGLPPFRNDNVLLDTPEVRRLVEEERAIFIDVRYPEEFERGHLPGALNMTLRKMTSAEIETSFAQVPHQPIVAPCYDKRSCFYAQILGLRLGRLGYDFRGRYTVPHEYLPTAKKLPHVERWLAANEHSLLGAAQQPLVAALDWLRGQLGSLMLAVFAAIAALRLVLLPFTIKGERDQIVQHEIDGKIRDAKEKFADDPRRLKSAIRALYSAHALTPVRNVVGLIVQIFVLVVLFSAVSYLATEDSGAFLWIADVGSVDPLYILPALLGVLVYLQLEVGADRHTLKFAALRMVGGAVFIAITFKLKAALVLYLIFGLLLMLVQNLAIRALMARQRRLQDEPLPAAIAPLAVAHRIPGAGRKAHRLGELIQAGVPVPRGLVIPHASFLKNGKGTQLDANSKKHLNRLVRRLGMRQMAVRSSGASEDGASFSYAGVFDSLLNIGRDGLLDAVAKVRESYSRGTAANYGTGDSTGGVIVQTMIDAEYAGILFTEHPAQSGTLLVEMTEGLADNLASGTESANSFAFGRLSGLLRADAEPPIDLKPLIALAMRVEGLFGQPQDLEWAYAKGRFYILQARDITAMERISPSVSAKGIFERERHRLLQLAQGCAADDTILAQNELSELLPRPTPLSVSFMEELWKPGGSVDLACHSLGVPYDVQEGSDPMVVSVFGSLYINVQEQRRRTRKGIGAMASFRLSRGAEGIERNFREEFLPEYLSELRLLEAMDFGRIPTSDLVGLFEDTSARYFHESHVQVDMINIAADFYVKVAERAMRKRKMNSGAVLGLGAASVMHQAMDVLGELRQGRATPEEFLSVFGHRSTVDYELASPRYREDIGMMESLIRNAASLNGKHATGRGIGVIPDDRTLALAITRARQFQSLKEEAKHYSLREFAVLRRMLVELDRRLALDGGIFYLEFADIVRLRLGEQQLGELKRLVAERQAAAAFFAGMQPLGTAITLNDLETMGMSDSGRPDSADDEGELRGSLVAGSEAVVGRARVLSGQDIQSVGKDEIVVARYMHPSWTPVFPRLKGIVTEVGGWLSHTSILAREYNITTIIGVKSAEYRVNTGDLVRLNLDGSVEILERAQPEIGEKDTISTEIGKRPIANQASRNAVRAGAG